MASTPLSWKASHSRCPADQPILLIGQGYWLETATPEWERLEWHISNSSRPLGVGSRQEVTLPRGQYVITLLAGSDDYRGTAEVSIVVEWCNRCQDFGQNRCRLRQKYE